MTAIAPTDAPVTYRRLARSFGERLLAINRACPLVADMTLRFDREPDFFAWPDRVFEDHQYFGIFVGEQLVGYCLAGFRTGWLGTGWGRYAYLGDARVLPEFRGAGLGRAAGLRFLSELRNVADVGVALVKRGNRPGKRMIDSVRPEGVEVRSLGAYDVFNVPLLMPHFAVGARGLTIRTAEWGDLARVAGLLTRWGAGRLLAPYFDEATLRARWQLPGLGVDRHIVAERGGQIVGVLGLWNLHDVRQVTLLDYDWRSAPIRAAFWLGARLAKGVAALPSPGEALHGTTVTDLAVADDDPAVLRHLLVAAAHRSRGHGCHVLQVGLFESDPLRPALRRMLAQRFTSDVVVGFTPAGAAAVGVNPRVPHLDLAMV